MVYNTKPYGTVHWHSTTSIGTTHKRPAPWRTRTIGSNVRRIPTSSLTGSLTSLTKANNPHDPHGLHDPHDPHDPHDLQRHLQPQTHCLYISYELHFDPKLQNSGLMLENFSRNNIFVWQTSNRAEFPYKLTVPPKSSTWDEGVGEWAACLRAVILLLSWSSRIRLVVVGLGA
jgi:hypothetical protein